MASDQHIIACIERGEAADATVAWARAMAERFSKSLMLLTATDDPTDDAWLKAYGIPFAALKGDWRTVIGGLPTLFNGILAVTCVDTHARPRTFNHPRQVLRNFSQCKIAYLCVPPRKPEKTVDSVCLTIDYRRESKEKLIWASYFARFGRSRLVVASPDYQDEGLRLKWGNNMRFVKKMYDGLSIKYEGAVLDSRLSTVNNPDRAALEAVGPDLLVAMTTDPRERDLADLIAGPPEQRLIKQTEQQPILFLNQRDDLYVLCD